MKERDYIIAAELARIRCAQQILGHVVIANVSSAVRTDPEVDRERWADALRLIDVMAARLERALNPGDPSKEPWRGKWPRGTLAWPAPPEPEPKG